MCARNVALQATREGESMRVIHSGWAVTRYGKSSVSISDPEGKEVFHSNDTFVPEDETELKRFLKDYLRGKDYAVTGH